MNQNLYKVIFNKTTGLMTAVAEVAHNNGKSSGADSSLSVIASEKSERGNLLTTTSSVISFGSLLNTQDCSTIGGLISNPTNDRYFYLSGSLKPIAATLLIAGLMGLSQHSYAEAVKTQITADKSAPKNQQAQVLKTANGKAQVNISTVTARGVSMNQYTTFNVGDNDSVIINNSRKATNTQTSGWINGNPNLARGEAKIIVNQVNSNDPSKLNGYIEIGGKKAELIMANPSGIKVNGGGFINANKVQLVSGSVKFDDGAVKGFSVDKQNAVEINGRGMDASGTEYTQIISAAAKINAEIYGNTENEIAINAVSGNVDEDGKGKNQGQVAVDVSNLGGMYAGKITLVGNEKGFGVNNQGKLIAANNIHIDASGKVSNTAGTDKDGNKTGIISADTVEIKAQKLEDTGVIQGKNTQIKTQDKLTLTSKLVAEDKLDIQSDKGIENKTELLSQNIQLKTHNLNNANTGKVRAMNLISADISGDLDNDGEINGTHTDLQVKGDMDNAGKINGEIVQFNAQDLKNSGEIEASEMVYGKVSGSLSNTGLINSGDKNNRGKSVTYLNAQGNIDNTGNIWGDTTALGASTINNHESDEKDPNGNAVQAGVIAGRNRLSMGAKEIVNDGVKAEILLTENGTFAIGGALDDNGVVTGRAEKLINNGALLSLNGSGKFGVKTLINKNIDGSLKVEEKLIDSEHIKEYSPYGSAEKYVEGKDGWYDRRSGEKDQKHAVFHFYDGRKDWQEVWNIYNYTQNTYQEQVTDNKAGRIYIGGNLVADIDDWKNNDSHFMVGQGIQFTGKVKGLSDIENNETPMNKRVEKIGTQTKSYWKKSWYSGKRRPRRFEDSWAYHPDDINTKVQKGDYIVQQNTAPKLTHKTLDLTNLSSVFKIDLQDAKQGQAKPYLVETDPRFTNYRDWLAGNYMLDRLQPDNLMKRIGDGYYEQRLINEQVAMLTGYRYLGGFASDEEQFKALMDNGIAVADDLQLTVGVKLTKDQVNRLTQDIVWYEKQTVTLPNGESQEVLVPQVYLAKAGNSSVILSEAKNLNDTAKGATIGSGSLNATNGEQKQRYYTLSDGKTYRSNVEITEKDGKMHATSDGDIYIANADMTEAQQNYRYATGSVISANTMDLTDIGELNNTGTIQAKAYLNIDGKQINNSGSLKSDIVKANADEMNIIGGDVTADRAVLLTADKVNIASTTSTNKDGTTVLNQVGQVKLTGKNADGLILINAQDKITTNAANIENNAQNGQTVLTAKDIDLGTITLAHKEKFGEATDKNHRIVETTQEVGSNIQGAGDIKIIANDTLTGTAVNINSQSGTTTLYGENSVDIKEGRQTLDLDEGYESKSKGLLSSKTTTARIVRHDDEAIHSNITGKNAVIIGSRGDVNIVGANIISGDESDVPTTAQQGLSGSLNYPAITNQAIKNTQNNTQNKPKTVIYSENGDVNIQAAQNFYHTEEEKTVKKSGLLGTGGIGFTIGQQKTKTESDNTALIHSGSMVGSLGGDTQIYAGKNYSQVGSTVSSVGGETTISADKVDIVAAQNRNEDKYKQTFEQKGLTIALSSAITDLAQSAYGVAKSAEKVGKSKNNRVNAMAAFNTGYGAYSVAKDAGKMMGVGQGASAANGKNPQGSGSAVKVSITYGQQKNTQESNSISTAAQASEVFGDKVNITARKDDINIIGSDVSGSTNTDLSAAKNVNIASFEEIYTNRSQNKSFGWNAGVAVEFGQGMSLGFTGGANYGKGHENADSTTHRNSHVGSTTGKTSITAGETVNIKGGQVSGKGVDLTAKDLNIESMQDTMTYDSRQENISGSVTVGYGVSGSASYSKSKVNADYASVNEQSGIFAGDDGYRINVKNHTDLKGGLITSTDKAEKDGKNAFSTGTLTFEDLANKSEYSGSGFGIGIQGTVSGSGSNPNVMNVADKNSLSHNGIGYASDSDSQSSVTKSGINTANIVITDKNKQKEITGKSAEETIQAVKTDITTDNYAANQGSLKNNFDAAKVQGEIDLGVEVMQDFSRNVQDLNRRKNIELDELKEELKAGKKTQEEYDSEVKKIETQKVVINMIAGGLMSPSDSALGIATSTVSPAVSYAVGQHFKKEGKEGSFEHIATHAVIGALTSAANGGNALSGAVSAGGAEYIAQVTAETLFQKDAKDLTADEKETVSSIAQIVGTVSGSLNGDSSLDAYVGGTVATNAVENNNMFGRTARPRIRTTPEQEQINETRADALKIHFQEVKRIIPNFKGLPVARNIDEQGRGIVTQSEVDEMQQFANWLKTQPRGLSEQEYVYNFRMSKTNIPPNLSPMGAGRNGAFGQVKRDFNILSSRQPEFVTPNYDRKGNIQPGRTYYFPTGRVVNNGMEYTVIRDDAAGHFPYYPYGHFNVSTQYLNQMREPVAKPINHNVHYDYPSK